MKWDILLPGWDEVVRLEVKARSQSGVWEAYLAIAFSGREPLCWLIGENGFPFRFEGPTEDEVRGMAKDHLERQYKVVRKVWS
jgi:hypothetical protein